MSVIIERVSRNVASILINRPNKRNALNSETINSLKNALRTIDQDEDIYAAVIGGVGGNFCAGYDVTELVNPETGQADLQKIKQMLLPIGTRLTEKKITIAAIEGHAAGLGYEIALRCDFRVADKDARLGFMNRRLGIPIMNGGTVILPRMIGYAKALELIATGKAQLAPEALQYGVIHYISNIGCAFGRSINVARCVAKFNQSALLQDFQSLRRFESSEEIHLLNKEQESALEYLKHCGKLTSVSQFIAKELYRHGSFDMGNLIQPDPECTL